MKKVTYIFKHIIIAVPHLWGGLIGEGMFCLSFTLYVSCNVPVFV